MERVTISEKIDIRDGTHESPQYVHEGYPLLTSKNIVSNRIDYSVINYISKNDYDFINKRSKVNKNDILMPMIGTIGNPLIVTDEPNYAIKNVALFRTSLSKDFSPKYIYYFLNSNFVLNQLNSYKRGGTQNFVSLSNIRSLLIAMVDLPTQERIVQELDTLNNIISYKRKQIQELDNLAESLFHNMFGDMDFKKELLENLCSIITDGSHNPPKGIEESSEYMMLSSLNIFDGKIHYDKVRYLTEEDYTIENKRTNIQIHDLLVTIVGTIGRTAVVKENRKIVLQRSVSVIRAKKSIINVFFLEYLIGTQSIKEQLSKNARGVAQKGIYLKDMRKLNITVPPIELQNQFAERIEKIEEQKALIADSIKEFETLRDSYMYKYFG